MKQFLKRAFYTIAGLPLVNYLSHPWRGRACVLCYHRVSTDAEFEADKSPNSNLIIPASKFEKQICFLSENHEVVSMDELVSHLKSEPYGDSNKFVIAVTFDDGYKDNLIHALPILEQYNIPVIIYITTRFPEGETWMWWFEIWDYLENNDSLEVNEIPEGLIIGTQKQKIQCFNKLLDWILNLPYEEQKKAVEKITQTASRKQYTNLCLSWEEIKILDQHPLVTIGAHTHSHPNLKTLTEEDAILEMNSSKMLLEQELGHPIKHFAYPFGTANEADTREFEFAHRCGYRTAVTTRPETIRSPPLHAIPRMGVPNYLTLQGFKGKLSGWECLIKKIL